MHITRIIFGLGLLLCLAGVVFTAGQAAETDTGTAKTDTMGYTLPIADPPGSITLSMAMPDYPASYNTSMANNLPVWQEIEKRTGIKVDWQVLPGSDYNVSIQTRVAAGRDLPDIFHTSNLNAVKLYSDGVTTKLNDLIDRKAPNIKRILAEEWEVKAAFSAPDGTIVLATGFLPETWSNPKNMYYRGDWMEALGLEEPDELEEYFDMLLAFKNQDLNQTGKDDVVALGIGNLAQLGWFGKAFDLHLEHTGGFSLDPKSGIVSYDPIRPEYKEYLAFCNRMYEAGILPEEVLLDGKTINAMKATGTIGMWWSGLGACQGADTLLQKAGIPDGYHVCAIPPATEDGRRYMDSRPKIAEGTMAISSQCKDPESAISYLDFIWGSEEGRILQQFGVEGLSYTRDDQGKFHYTDFVLYNEDGYAANGVLWSIGSYILPLWRNSDEWYLVLWEEKPHYVAMQMRAKEYWPPQTTMPYILSDETEARRYTSVAADVETYVEEMSLKMIMGIEPLSSFDKFVSTLKSMGVDEMIKIRQSQVDRFNN